MRKYIEAFNGFALWMKILLALPILDILWVIYRLFLSIEKKNLMGIIIASLLIIIGLPLLWIVDIITICMKDKVLWID